MHEQQMTDEERMLRAELSEGFEKLKLDANLSLGEIEHEARENESLAQEYPEWDVAEAYAAERWVNDSMQLGWRVYVRGFQLAPRHAAHLTGKLRNRGWDNVEVVPQ